MIWTLPELIKNDYGYTIEKIKLHVLQFKIYLFIKFKNAEF